MVIEEKKTFELSKPSVANRSFVPDGQLPHPLIHVTQFITHKHVSGTVFSTINVKMEVSLKLSVQLLANMIK